MVKSNIRTGSNYLEELLLLLSRPRLTQARVVDNGSVKRSDGANAKDYNRDIPAVIAIRANNDSIEVLFTRKVGIYIYSGSIFYKEVDLGTNNSRNVYPVHHLNIVCWVYLNVVNVSRVGEIHLGVIDI